MQRTKFCAFNIYALVKILIISKEKKPDILRVFSSKDSKGY